MDEYLYKSTRRSRDYNKSGEWMLMLMAMVMMRVMMMKTMLLPPRILVDARSMPSASSSFGSLQEVRFCKFLVSLCIRSPIRLHGVGVFDEAKPPTPDTIIDTGGLCPYGCPKVSGVCLLNGLPPRCVNKYSVHFCSFRFAFYSSEITYLITPSDPIYMAPCMFFKNLLVIFPTKLTLAQSLSQL
jgi:hypothetical protein